MTVDQREKAISASKVLFKIPRYRRTLVLLILATFAFGFLYRLYTGAAPASAFVYGGGEGVLLLALPALLASALASLYSKQKFKYFAFVSALSAVIAGVAYFIGLAAGQILAGVVVANALVVLVWFIASYIGLAQGTRKSALLSFLQVFFNVSFLWFWQRFGFIESTFPVGSPIIAALKIIIAAGIMLLGLWALFYVINAPAKRNFGVSTVQALAFFFAQWTTGDKEFEDVLAEMGEPVQTNVEGAVFKNSRGALKAIFLSPQVHFGPFGNLGGSEFPVLLSQKISSETGAPCLVFHSTVNHDFNPVYSSSHALVVKTVLEEVKALQKPVRAKEFSAKACFTQAKTGAASVAGWGFGRNVFLTLSRAPESTEDIELSLGLALKNAALKNWDNAVLVDRHNSITDGSIFRTGSQEYFEFEDAVKKARCEGGTQKQFKIGISQNALEGFALENGIGKAGLKTVVFEIDGGKRKAKKYCFVLIDGNNILPSFRAKALLALKQYGFDWAEVFSTDTHSVNNLGGVHNPVGKNADQEKLVAQIGKSVGVALADLQPARAAFFSRRISISVLGGRRQSELISTINSIVAIARVLAPAIFILSIILVLLLLAVH